MKTLATCILILVLLTAAGCEESAAGPGHIAPSAGPTPPEPINPSSSLDGPDARDKAPQTIYLIHLQLATVEVPLGVASGSEELWSRLDEEPVSLRSRVLGMNGFRVGLGRNEDWDDIERTLKRMTGQSFRSATVQAMVGRPAPIELKSNQPTRLMFTTHEDQTLSGEHVPPGDYLLTLTCTLDEDDPSKVLVTAVPQIRSTRRMPKLVHERGVTTLVHRPSLITLTPLAFQLTVPNNDFLVVGPGILARRPTSPGQAFLAKDRNGVPFETVVLLRPMVHAVRLAPTPKEDGE
ncbi:MAG: hypothetical protein JW849_00955 [Phycisphaerae bacterium]|nr:hypothetical protein [Phycisphaerae bacterium]